MTRSVGEYTIDYGQRVADWISRRVRSRVRVPRAIRIEKIYEAQLRDTDVHDCRHVDRDDRRVARWTLDRNSDESFYI